MTTAQNGQASGSAAKPDFFAQLGAKLKAEAAIVGKDLLEIGEEVVNEGEKLLEQLVNVVAPIAMQEVVAQIPMIADGRTKFGTAVTATYEKAVSAGVPLLIQDAQMLVQAAATKAEELFGSAVFSKNTQPAAT